MPYCQNCGAEVAGNFCPNCGAQAGTVTPAEPMPIIHKDVDVKPRYNTVSLAIAGWLGFSCLIMTLVFIILGGVITAEATFSETMAFWVATLICAGLTYLCYLPGINTIRKYSPEGEVMSTFWSFFGKSFLIIFAWGVTLAGCVYIVGIFFKVWRFGLWASRPNDDQYTAFVDGKKIPVTRYYDDLPGYGPRGQWVYMDNNGEFYRPPVK